MAPLQLQPQPSGSPVKQIVYGIVDSQRVGGAELPTGLQGAKLTVVTQGAVAAILSPVSEEPDGSAGVEGALAFARVVGDLHREMTILPMRYGSFVYQAENAAEFLRRHEHEFSEALASLGGCDEMGVRILLPVTESGRGPSDDPPGDRSTKTRGAAYLESRRRHYMWQEREEQACREWAERAGEAFAGLFRRSHWEYAVRQEGTLLSLSFLVDRSCVPAFVKAFRKFEHDHPVTAICTGPFPPYVFVAALSAGTAIRDDMELQL